VAGSMRDDMPTDVMNVVVCEKRPRWTPELQREFHNEAVRVRCCRSANEVERTLRQLNADLLLLDLEVGPGACLQLLGAAARRVTTIVVGSRQTAELEWSMRELGAATFLPETLPGHELAHLCRKLVKMPRAC
jgi:DNA-binding response OmpR family regulator